MGDSNTYFFPSLKKELLSFGEIVAPSFPNPEQPCFDEWRDYFVQNVIDQNFDLTVCHSLGGTFAMNLISQGVLSTRCLVTISSSHGPKSIDCLNTFLSPKIDLEKLKELEKYFVIQSFDDPYTHPEFGTLLVKQANAIGLFYNNLGHFEVSELPQDVMSILISALQ